MTTEINFIDFVTDCFNSEFDKINFSLRKLSPEEKEKAYSYFEEYFFGINQTRFFSFENVESLSTLFNNRTGDGLVSKDLFFVGFMENFACSTLTKLPFYYGEKSDSVLLNAIDSVSKVLTKQFNSAKVSFYKKELVSEIAIKSEDIAALFESVPMLLFYYLVITNINKTVILNHIAVTDSDKKKLRTR
jgi:hypothetical protein